jgi:hypothetical protein
MGGCEVWYLLSTARHGLDEEKDAKLLPIMGTEALVHSNRHLASMAIDRSSAKQEGL